MGFQLDFISDGEIKIQLPKENSKEKWELAKKIVDMYFATEIVGKGVPGVGDGSDPKKCPSLPTGYLLHSPQNECAQNNEVEKK